MNWLRLQVIATSSAGLKCFSTEIYLRLIAVCNKIYVDCHQIVFGGFNGHWFYCFETPKNKVRVTQK